MRLGVEVVDGLDKTDAPDLKEIVDVLPAGGKALDDGQHEPQIARDQLFAGGLVALPDAQQQPARGGAVEHGEFRGVDAANLYLSLHIQQNLLWQTLVFPQRRSFYTFLAFSEIIEQYRISRVLIVGCSDIVM